MLNQRFPNEEELSAFYMPEAPDWDVSVMPATGMIEIEASQTSYEASLAGVSIILIPNFDSADMAWTCSSNHLELLPKSCQ